MVVERRKYTERQFGIRKCFYLGQIKPKGGFLGLVTVGDHTP